MINNPKIEYLREKANALPKAPGVYLMKNADGQIIYIGKSKKLKNRVSSYFVDTAKLIKTEKMVSLVRDFDTILCDTEIEALTLENVLIKKHNPKYNISLKDSKSYPYIKITNEEYPKIIMTRELKNDKALYLGPYSGTTVANDAIDTVRRAFRLPSCKRTFPRDIGKERPCLYRHMGRCIAPCTGEITREEYASLIAGARHVLEGNVKATIESLTKEMQNLANEERFEEASRLRDTIISLRALREKQKVVIDTDSQKDIWASYECEVCSVLTVLSVRDGALNAKNDFVFPRSELFDSDAMISFIYEYYENNFMPSEILLAKEPEEDTYLLLCEYVKSKSKKTVIKTPKKGAPRHLCDMAYENAKERAEKYIRETEKTDNTLVKLASILSLETVPERIEAYDISNLGSEHLTAGMTVCENGAFKKSDYRKFNIKSVEGTDDYASMEEALTRRLAHIGDGSDSLSKIPDLILVDGGRGHVGIAKKVLEEANLPIPVFGMVKDDFHKTRALTDGENEISIARENSVYVLIYKIQEEVHRYTVGAMQSAKRKTIKHSQLEEIKGIGAVKAKRLLMRFGSVKRISEMSEEELITKDINETDAHNIYTYFEVQREKGDTK